MTPKEFAKKIIASINPGTADISGIGDGTIKGAISEQNKNMQNNYRSTGQIPFRDNINAVTFSLESNRFSIEFLLHNGDSITLRVGTDTKELIVDSMKSGVFSRNQII